MDFDSRLKSLSNYLTRAQDPVDDSDGADDDPFSSDDPFTSIGFEEVPPRYWTDEAIKELDALFSTDERVLALQINLTPDGQERLRDVIGRLGEIDDTTCERMQRIGDRVFARADALKCETGCSNPEGLLTDIASLRFTPPPKLEAGSFCLCRGTSDDHLELLVGLARATSYSPYEVGRYDVEVDRDREVLIFNGKEFSSTQDLKRYVSTHHPTFKNAQSPDADPLALMLACLRHGLDRGMNDEEKTSIKQLDGLRQASIVSQALKGNCSKLLQDLKKAKVIEGDCVRSLSPADRKQLFGPDNDFGVAVSQSVQLRNDIEHELCQGNLRAADTLLEEMSEEDIQQWLGVRGFFPSDAPREAVDWYIEHMPQNSTDFALQSLLQRCHDADQADRVLERLPPPEQGIASSLCIRRPVVKDTGFELVEYLFQKGFGLPQELSLPIDERSVQMNNFMSEALIARPDLAQHLLGATDDIKELFRRVDLNPSTSADACTHVALLLSESGNGDALIRYLSIGFEKNPEAAFWALAFAKPQNPDQLRQLQSKVRGQPTAEALGRAVSIGNATAVELMFAALPDPSTLSDNERGEYLRVIVDSAVALGDPSVLRPVIQSNWGQARDSNGETLLHLAATENLPLIVAVYQDCGVSVPAREGVLSPLQIASKGLRLTCCKHLTGGDLSPSKLGGDIENDIQGYFDLRDESERLELLSGLAWKLFLNSELEDVLAFLEGLEANAQVSPSHVEQVRRVLLTKGGVITRLAQPKYQDVVHREYGRRYSSYFEQQQAYSERRNTTYLQTLGMLREQPTTPLAQVFNNLVAGRKETGGGGFAAIRTDHLETPSKGKQSHYYPTLRWFWDARTNTNSKSTDVRTGIVGHTAGVYKSGSGKDVTLTRSTFRMPLEHWTMKHVSGQDAFEIFWDLDKKWEGLVSMPTNSEEEFAQFQRQAAEFYALGCHALLTNRGHSQHMMETHKLLYEIHGYYVVPKQSIAFPDCVALAMHPDDFLDVYDQCFSFIPISQSSQ